MHPYCEHGHRVWRYQKQTLGLLARSRTMGASSLSRFLFLPGIGFDNPLAQQKGSCHIRGGYPNPCFTETRGGCPYNWITKTRGGYSYPWITKNRGDAPTLGSPKPGMDISTIGPPQPPKVHETTRIDCAGSCFCLVRLWCLWWIWWMWRFLFLSRMHFGPEPFWLNACRHWVTSRTLS